MLIVQQWLKRHKPSVKADDRDSDSSEMEDNLNVTLHLANIKSNSKSTVGGGSIDDINTGINTSNDELAVGDTAPKIYQSPESPTTDIITKEQIFDFVNQAGEGMEMPTDGQAKSTTEHRVTGDATEIDDIPIDVLFGVLDKNVGAGGDINTSKLTEDQKTKEQLMKSVIIEEIRQRILNRTYSYSHRFKYIAIGCIVIWSIICAVITTLWCLWFDANLFLNNNYQSEWDIYYNNCTNGDNVIPLKTSINYNVTEYEITNLLASFDGYFYKPPANDTFNENYDVAQRFLLCVFLSYILSVFLWQPLVLGVKAAFQLRGYFKHPDRVNEAALFYNMETFGGKSGEAVIHSSKTRVEASGDVEMNIFDKALNVKLTEANDDGIHTGEKEMILQEMDAILSKQEANGK